eukprot:7517695-Lingulodinium_polyedra.AAC.1
MRHRGAGPDPGAGRFLSSSVMMAIFSTSSSMGVSCTSFANLPLLGLWNRAFSEATWSEA